MKDGREIDVYGVQEGTLTSSYLLVECKDKASVTKADLVHFMSKVKYFRDHLSPTHGVGLFPSTDDIIPVLAYTGAIDDDVMDAARGFTPEIRLKKF